MSRSAARAVGRIAWRNIRRSVWRTVLIVVLILLPVTAMIGGLIYYRSTTPTSDEAATSSLGVADALIYPGSPDSGQSTADLAALLPAGSAVEAVTYHDRLLVLGARRIHVIARSLDPNGLARGIVTLTSGRLPEARDEVAVTASVASVAGLAIGDRLELEGSGASTVVGLIEVPSRLSSLVVLQDPALAEASVDPSERAWLVALPTGAEMPFIEPEFSVQSRAEWGRGSSDLTLGTLIVGAMALAMTMLIGSAAFAVGIRRRQRELGLLAAVGGSRLQLVASVLGEGLLIAGVAVGLALLIGFTLNVLASPWFDEFTDRRNHGLVIDAVGIGLAGLVGLMSGVLAAAAPAWTAARLPPLVALSGRRPSTSSARRTLALGLVLVSVSVALTATGAATLIGDRSNNLAPFMIAGAAMLGVLGFGATSPWLIERLELLGLRLPLAGRIALRDTARARSRTAPIVTATLAGLAAAIAFSTVMATESGRAYEDWRPYLRQDQLLIVGQDAARLGPDLASNLSAIAAAPRPSALVATDGSERQLVVAVTNSGAAPDLDPIKGCDDCREGFAPAIGSRAFLAAVGAESAIADFEQGAVILLVDGPFEAHEATLAVIAYDVRTTSPEGIEYDSRIAASEPLPARAANVGAAAATGNMGRLPTALISTATAARLGFEASPEYEGAFLIRVDHPVTEAEVAMAAALLADSPGTIVDSSFRPPDHSDLARLVAVMASLLLALTVTAIAVALGEAEARSSLRTLLAVGAAPALRRRIVAARAGVTSLIAGLLALPAGLLPVWGLYASRDQPIVVPLPELLAIIALLPLVAAAGGLMLSRPIPQWSTFRDVEPE